MHRSRKGEFIQSHTTFGPLSLLHMQKSKTKTIRKWPKVMDGCIVYPSETSANRTLPFILGINKFLYVPVFGQGLLDPTSSQRGLFQLQPKQVSPVGNRAVAQAHSQALALNFRGPGSPGSRVTTRGTSGLPSKFVAQTSLSHCTHTRAEAAATANHHHFFPTFRVHVTSVPRKYHNLTFDLCEVFLGCCNEKHSTRPDHP